jgi:hypothetical protein
MKRQFRNGTGECGALRAPHRGNPLGRAIQQLGMAALAANPGSYGVFSLDAPPINGTGSPGNLRREPVFVCSLSIAKRGDLAFHPAAASSERLADANRYGLGAGFLAAGAFSVPPSTFRLSNVKAS